jgi:hypothetical protein
MDFGEGSTRKETTRKAKMQVANGMELCGLEDGLQWKVLVINP